MPERSKTKKPRSKKTDSYRSFRLQKKIRPKTKPLQNPIRLARNATKVMLDNKRLLLGFTLVYAVLYLFLVRGFGSVVNIDLFLERTDLTRFTQSVNIFSDVVSSGGIRAGAAGVYQVLLFIAFSLGLLWIIRSIKSGTNKRISIREAYYFGTAQFVPYTMTLVFTLLMLVPMGFGTLIIETARRNNLIISNIEQAGFLVFTTALAMTSLFLLTNALFSLIVVSLSGVKPGDAIATGWRLVKHRRASVVVRLLLLLLIVAVKIILIVLPVVFIHAPSAEYVFYVVSLMMIVYAHIYIYELYKEMIS